MRVLGRIGLGLALLILVLLASLPYLWNWDQYKQPIIAFAQTQLGRNMSIDGAIALHLLPTPSLVINNARLANIEGAPSDSMISAQVVTAKLAWLPLLVGRFTVVGYEIYNGQLNLETTAQGKANWEFALAAPTQENFRDLQVKLHQVNVSFFHAPFSIDHHFHKVEAVAQLSDHAGAMHLESVEGSLPFANDAVRFKGALSQAAEGGQQKLSLNLQSKQFTLISEGAVALPGGTSLFEGTVEVQMTHPTALTQYVTAEDFDEQAMRFTNPVTIKGPIQISRQGVLCETLQVVSSNLASTAKMQVRFGAPAQVTVDWGIEKGDLTPYVDSLRASLAGIIAPRDRLSPVAGYVSDVVHDMVEHLSELMDIKWNIQAKQMSYNGQDIRDIVLHIEVKGGIMRVQPCQAQLPYGTTLALNGAVVSHGARPIFQGTLDITGNELGSLLTWMDIQIHDEKPVPADGKDAAVTTSTPNIVNAELFKQFSFESEITLTANEIRISRLQALVNAFEVSGEWVMKRGKVPMVNATLTVENLDLDAYSLTGPLQKTLLAYSPQGDSFKKETYQWLMDIPFEADIEVNFDELKLQGAAIENVDVAFHIATGTLTLNHLSLMAGNFDASAKLVLDLRGYSPILNVEVYGKSFDTTILKQFLPPPAVAANPVTSSVWSKERFTYPGLYLLDGSLKINLGELRTRAGTLQKFLLEGRFSNRALDIVTLKCQLASGDLSTKGQVQFKPLRAQLAFGIANARLGQLLPVLDPTIEMDGYASTSGTASFGGETVYDIIASLQVSASVAIRNLITRAFDFDHFIAAVEDGKFTTPEKVPDLALASQNMAAPATIYNVDGTVIGGEGSLTMQNIVFDTRRVKGNLAGRMNLKDLSLDFYSKVAYTDHQTAAPINFDLRMSGAFAAPILTFGLDQVTKAVTDRVTRAANAPQQKQAPGVPQQYVPQQYVPQPNVMPSPWGGIPQPPPPPPQ
jgi:uncharacterized protein involved in outer membrane biogenesis